MSRKGKLVPRGFEYKSSMHPFFNSAGPLLRNDYSKDPHVQFVTDFQLSQVPWTSDFGDLNNQFTTSWLEKHGRLFQKIGEVKAVKITTEAVEALKKGAETDLPADLQFDQNGQLRLNRFTLVKGLDEFLHPVSSKHLIDSQAVKIGDFVVTDMRTWGDKVPDTYMLGADYFYANFEPISEESGYYIPTTMVVAFLNPTGFSMTLDEPRGSDPCQTLDGGPGCWIVEDQQSADRYLVDADQFMMNFMPAELA